MTRRERLERKLELRTEWAAKADARADARFDSAHAIVANIPLGQPILVGHHSEKRHRRDIDRMSANMSKGVEESKLAEHHRSAANGIERALDTSIFSDDENAIEALEARISEHEKTRDRMKLVNKFYRKGDAAALAELGLDLERLRAQVAGVGLSFVRAPYEGYQLTNLGARIAADRKRIAAIRQRAARTAAAEDAGGCVIEGAGEYCRVTFAEKPEREILAALRAAGFWWRGGSWNGRRSELPGCVTALASSEDAETTAPVCLECRQSPAGADGYVCDPCRASLPVISHE